MDMSAFIAPKSTQLNADDLMGGPRTIRITRVSGTGNSEQPVSVSFDGDEGRPFLPCKSMRRVMIACWGKMANEYAGRSMTLYRDPSVAWGGMEIGGIRISHMSHIDSDMTLALTATKKARKPYTVRVLRGAAASTEKPAAPAEDKAPAIAESIVSRVDAATSHAALEAVTGDDLVVKQRAWLAKNRPELAKRVDDAVGARLADFDRVDADEGIPA